MRTQEDAQDEFELVRHDRERKQEHGAGVQSGRTAVHQLPVRSGAIGYKLLAAGPDRVDEGIAPARRAITRHRP